MPKRNQKADPGIHKIQDPICNFPILPTRVVPWDGPRGIQLTPNAETRNKRNRLGRVVKIGKRKGDPDILKIQDPTRYFQILPLLGVFRGVPGGGPRGRPLTPSTQHGNAKKKTKPPRMGDAERNPKG